MGVKFKATTPGQLAGIRFYKGNGNTGTHTGHLWTASGQLLASVTFQGETSRGWQQGLFSRPVTLTANTEYVASYFAPAGHYAGDNGYFARAGFTKGPLYAYRDGEAGHNGVYTYGKTSSFPTRSWNASNYYVDVLFVPSSSNGTGQTLLFGNAAVASVADNSGAGSAEAFNFSATASGTRQALKLYVDTGNSASTIHLGVYSGGSGPQALLSECTLTNPASGAWNTCSVANGPSISAGVTYWVAVLSPAGGGSPTYRDENGGTSYESSSASLSELPASWSSGASWASQGLSVQALGTATAGQDAGTPADAGTPPATDAGTSTPDAGTPPSTDAGTPPGADGGLPAGVTLRDIDGSSTYYTVKSAHSAWMDSVILLGAWLEEPLNSTEVGYDFATHDNIYWNLAASPTSMNCGGPCRADYDIIRQGGMHASAPDVTANSGSETVSYSGTDESDMNFGPGSNGWNPNGPWNGSACIPANSGCGFTVNNFYYTGQPTSDGSPGYPINGTAIHQNNGKGVLFWESDSDAAKFLTYSDTASADSYWMTDPDLNQPSQGGCALLPNDPVACNGSGLTDAQRKLPANYQYNVTRLQKLNLMNGGSKPIVVPIELDCPGQSGCSSPPQFKAAAVHSLIAGARGIIWFQHNFGGSCGADRLIIDATDPSSPLYSCVEASTGWSMHQIVSELTAFNAQVVGINHVLLSPFADGYVTVSSGIASAMAKYDGSNFYVIAASGRPATPPPASQQVTFTLAGNVNGTITVLNENRTIPVTNGTFTDTFADTNAYHFYKVN